MGTILHEGEQIFVSRKITEEIGRSFRGYAVLIHIGIDIDKLTCAHDDTQHFLTYEVTEDLELPFDTGEWQDFEVNGVRFHAYTHNFKNLILMEHDGCRFDYFDEIDEFFEKEKKKNKIMYLMKENYIYITTNTWHFSDTTLITALLGFYTNDVKQENISATSDDHLLWSRTKFTANIRYNAVDALSRLHNLNTELDFVRSSKGDVIIYRNVNNEERIRIIEAYKKYSKDDDMEKFNCVKRNSGRYPFRLNTTDGDYLSLNGESAFLTARGNGKSALTMRHMLNSFYGLNGGLSYKKPPLKFKLIFGQEHATGRYKTICLWEDGEKTIIHGDNKVTKLPVAQAFAWCYVKRTFGTVSHFKKHVDKRTTKMDGVWYFEGDCIMDDYAQGSVPGTSKKRDIYDAAALAIVTKRYGGLRKLVDEYINKEDENGTR